MRHTMQLIAEFTVTPLTWVWFKDCDYCVTKSRLKRDKVFIVYKSEYCFCIFLREYVKLCGFFCAPI